MIIEVIMSLNISIQYEKKYSDNLYLCNLNQNDIRIFGTPRNNAGGQSVLFVKNLELDCTKSLLSFSPSDCTILNLGSQQETYIIKVSNSMNVAPNLEKTSYYKTSGDEQFLREVKQDIPHLYSTTESLIREIRTITSGYFEKSSTGTYVHKDDNFIAFKIQARDKSFKVSVRGEPDRFRNIPLDIKTDMNGYSRFKLNSPSQVSAVIQVIKKAKRKE